LRPLASKNIGIQSISNTVGWLKQRKFDMEIFGAAAIVTGGASGLGLATAKMLATNGAKVAIFDLNEEAGNAAAQSFGGIFHSVNVADEVSVTEGLDMVEAAHGTARILVNCAGIAPATKTVGRENKVHPLESYRKTIEVNLIGTFNVLSQFAARLAAADPIGEERGIIVNTASVAAYDGQIGQAAYGSSKAGVVGLTLPVARDLAQHLIRVMTIAPGIFMTPMMEGFPQHIQDALGAQVPHPRRLGKPDEFAQMVEAIVRNPMLNGEVIRLDGAIRMPPK
jgi:NAD(P)-dependent dehydrogenase (short-subunit alcohol dehydrogenase family)